MHSVLSRLAAEFTTMSVINAAERCANAMVRPPACCLLFQQSLVGRVTGQSVESVRQQSRLRLLHAGAGVGSGCAAAGKGGELGA